jgi:hypothetical protein
MKDGGSDVRQTRYSQSGGGNISGSVGSVGVDIVGRDKIAGVPSAAAVYVPRPLRSRRQSGGNSEWCNLRLVQRARLDAETPTEITPWRSDRTPIKWRHSGSHPGSRPRSLMDGERRAKQPRLQGIVIQTGRYRPGGGMASGSRRCTTSDRAVLQLFVQQLLF